MKMIKAISLAVCGLMACGTQVGAVPQEPQQLTREESRSTDLGVSADGDVWTKETMTRSEKVSRSGSAAGVQEVGVQGGTKRVTSVARYKSLVKLTVAKQTAYTTFSYTGHSVVEPKAVSSSTWTLPPTWTKENTSKWDFYGGPLGQANHFARFVFGVPTPWGPVGSTADSQINVAVLGDGSFSN